MVKNIDKALFYDRGLPDVIALYEINFKSTIEKRYNDLCS